MDEKSHITGILLLTQIVGFIALGWVSMYAWTLVAQVNEVQNKRMFQINNRLKTIEEQRDVERRLTNVEKQLRTYCTGNKTEMCGLMAPIDRK